MGKIPTRLITILCGVTIFMSADVLWAKKQVFKVATLAPEGSTWWKTFKMADERLRQLSGGEMSMRLYAGGVAGDEPDVVRKMRVGQLHGAALTSVGLAEIQPATLVLQAPGLFSSWEELDTVRKKMAGRLEKLLEKEGYAVLLWGDVGFNRVFSNTPVSGPSDMKNTKPWCWTQDGVFKEYYSAMGANPVLLGVPEVLSSLQTGLINAYVTPPLAALSLQWFNRAKYMLDLPVALTVGAVVVSKKKLDALTDEQRGWVQQVIRELHPALFEAVREDNKKAIAQIRNAGVTITQPTAEAKKAWARVAKQAADNAAGKVYPKELLEEARRLVEEFRASGH